MQKQRNDNDLPDVYFGGPADEVRRKRSQETPDDDEELTATPRDVVALLGFDPKQK